MIRAKRAAGALGLALGVLLGAAPALALSARTLDEVEEVPPAEAAPPGAEEVVAPAPPAAAPADGEPEAGIPPDGEAPPPASDVRAPEPDLYAPVEEAPPGDEWTREPDLYSDGDGADEAVVGGIREPDPFEEVNRSLFAFNLEVDRWVLDPASHAYDFVMPDVAERAVLRVFANINSPVILVNDVLQLEFKRAGITLTRFVVNSTAGLAGVLDVAHSMGLDGHESDFGLTLANAGVGSGPYVVIPVLGPSTVRDAVGFGVDLLFRPLFYLLGPFDFLIVGTGNGFVVRSSYMEELEALRESSVDYYATLRNAYFQRRAEQLREIGVEVAVTPP